MEVLSNFKNYQEKLYGKIDFHENFHSYRARISNSNKYKYLNCSGWDGEGAFFSGKSFFSHLFYFCKKILFSFVLEAGAQL